MALPDNLKQQHYSWHYRVSQQEVMPFPETSSDHLEEAFGDWQRRGEPNEVVVLKSGRFDYEVDFSKKEQRNKGTGRKRELVRKETRMGQELSACQAQLQEEQQANADLKRKVAETSKEFERNDQYADLKRKACEQQRDQLQRSWQQERLDLQGHVTSSQKQADESAARAQQLKQLLEQQQQAALKSEKELRKARAELEMLEGQSTEAAELRARLEACEQQRDQLQRSWQHERLLLQAQVTSSQKQADENAARAQQLKQLLKQQQQAALKSEEEPRKARAELEMLEGESTEAAELRARMEALQQGNSQWQFLGHLEVWQPYSEDMGRDMDALCQQWRAEGQPNKVYRLSDRYEVNFQEQWQVNVNHGKRRPIRKQLVPGTAPREPGANNQAELELQLLELQLADKEKALADMRERPEEQQGQALEEGEMWKWHLAEREEEQTVLLEKLREQLQEKQGQTEALTRSKEELALSLAGRETELEAVGKFLQQQQEQAKADAAEKEQQLLAKEKELAKLRRKFECAQERVPRLQSELKELREQLRAHEEGKALQERDKAITELRGSLSDAQAAIDKGRRAADSTRIDQMFGGKPNPLKQKVEQLQKELDATQLNIDEAVEARMVEGKAALKKATDENARLGKELKDYKESAKEKQAGVQKELKEKSAQLKRLQEQHALLVGNILTSECRSNMQALAARALPRDDEALLCRTGADLVDPLAKQMLEASARFRKEVLNLSATLIDVFGELREPDTQEVVESSTVLDVHSADFLLIQHLFQRSLTQHRLNYKSQEWCEPPRLRIVSIELLTMGPKLVKLYRSERERIGKRELPETPFPMAGAMKPVAAKDTNEFMLFHGCPWESVPSICTQGFDWKHRGSNQGNMFGLGIYFGPNASKCDLYSEMNAEGQKCMFLARVLLGASVPRWRGCPLEKNLGKDRDSICAATREFGGKVDHPEVCIFQKAQALPTAKIVYVHEDTCACHRCRSGRGE